MSLNQNSTDAGLSEVIDAVQSRLLTMDPDTEEFAKTVDQLDKLHKIRTSNRTGRVSPDALIAVAGNLLGIISILGYERAHVVTSKALGFVMKTRS